MKENNSSNNHTSQDLSLNERTALLLDYWKQTSNVQQHFNDVSMKLRNFAVVVFSGFLTGVGLSIHNHISITIAGVEISAGVLFAAAGMFATQLIHFMDTYWYHVFLKGAVNTSSSIEKEIKNILNVTELSDGISSNSQNVTIVSIFGFLYLPKSWNGWMKKLSPVLQEIHVDSTKRHKVFYRGLLLIFLVTGIGSIFSHSPLDNSDLQNHNNRVINNVYNIEHTKYVDGNDENTGYIISGVNVRVRSLPSFTSDIRCLLPVGKQITIIEDNKDVSWIKVSFDLNNKKIIGWVHRDFIATLKS